MAGERQTSKVEWAALLEEALTARGSRIGVYDRFHDYSITNMLLFHMQGIHEPVASASRWKQLGRQVVNWHNRKDVIVPRFVNVLGPESDTAGKHSKKSANGLPSSATSKW